MSEAYRFFDRRAIVREAAQAADIALASASASTAPEDARRWLEFHGFRVIVWNPHDSRGYVGMQQSGSNERRAIVQGQRQMRDGAEPTWLDLTFRFNHDGTFHDVQSRPSRLEVPTTRPAA
ncbi:MAG TPA: hypothetical protein VGN72_01645 [Tepidisphaeraceae bacterium]|nr:hypothetical protein [Tepidisphaeraceae bacterium]